MDLDVLITGGIGILSTIVSGFTTFFFTRRKYNAEVDTNEIKNLQESLNFYENIVKDNNKKLQFYINMAEQNRVETLRLKGVVYRLLNNSCLDTSCLKRKFFSEKEIKDILGEVINPNDVSNEIETKETVSQQ